MARAVEEGGVQGDDMARRGRPAAVPCAGAVASPAAPSADGPTPSMDRRLDGADAVGRGPDGGSAPVPAGPARGGRQPPAAILPAAAGDWSSFAARGGTCASKRAKAASAWPTTWSML